MIPASAAPSAGNNVNERLGCARAVPAEIGGAFVVADGGDQQTERRAPLDEDHDERHERENVDRNGQAEEIAGADETVFRLLADEMLLRTAQDQRRPARDAEHGQRDDDRRQLEEGDRSAVRKSHQRAHRKPRENDKDERQAGLERIDRRRDRPRRAPARPTGPRRPS